MIIRLHSAMSAVLVLAAAPAFAQHAGYGALLPLPSQSGDDGGGSNLLAHTN